MKDEELKVLDNLVQREKNKRSPRKVNNNNLITVYHSEAELEITYKYYKGSPMVMYYPDGSGHPGDPDEVEINSIKCDDLCKILDMFTDFASIQDFYDSIENKILEEHGSI